MSAAVLPHPVPATGADADARFDALIVSELGGEFALGPTVALGAGARTILARQHVGGETLLALHVFLRERERAREQARERDLETWAGLEHPHLAPILRRGTTPHLRWCIVPATEGGSLLSRLTAEGAMTITVAIRLAAQLAAALQVAHDAGLTHGALAPAHVMLDGAGEAVLTGFGFAPDTSAPASSDERDQGADQAALAALVYQCVTGEVSANGPESAMDYWRVPAAIRPVLQQARGARRSSRYRDVVAFLAALRSAQEAVLPRAHLGAGRSVPARSPGVLLLVEPIRPTRRRLPAIVIALLALAIVAALPSTPAPGVGDPPPPVGQATRPKATAASVRLTPPRAAPRPLPRTARRRPRLEDAGIGTVLPIPPPQLAPVIAPLRLEMRDATLTISSRPWGVVSVDGRYLGNTPVLGSPLTIGPHRIRIERAGFITHEVTVVARSGEDLRLVDITLRASPR